MKLVMRMISTMLLLAVLLSLAPGGTTSASAASCYWAQFVADVTIPDGTSFAPNTAFKKTWRLKNIGTCAWNSNDVSLIFDSGEKMNAPASLALPTTVNPGQTVDITVDMTSPAAAGHYFGYWKFKSNSGGTFGIGSTAQKSFWVEIRVASSAGTGYDFTANAASAAWSSGAGALTFPGTDGNANGFGLSQATPKLESGVTSAQPGLLFAPNNVTNGYVQASYPAFRVQSGDRFQATIGCEAGATNCYVAYSLNYQIGTGPVKTFWTFREKYEGWTYNVNLDLSSLANQDVKFTLVVSAYGSPVGDRAMWVNPIISRPGGAPPPPPTVTGTPPTATPTATGTIQPNACDRAQFVADVTVPDGTSFAPGIGFTKTWRLKNVGTCTWTNYSIMFDTGEKMGGPDSALIPTTVAPGQTVDITLNLTSPTTAGTYRGYWKLKNNTGVPFGIGSAGTKSFWVEIKVSGTGINPKTPTPPTPGTPVTPATPVSGTVYDFAANVCTAKWYTGAGEIPCPGTDGDSKGFVLIANPSRLETGTNDPRTGIITFPQNQNNGYIQGIYPSYQVKSGDKFRATIGCENGATSCYVVFRLDYSISGSSSIQTFWAFVEKFDTPSGNVYNADIDLTPLAGQSVKFILTVLSTGPATGDRALWAGPIIFNPSGASVPVASATPTATGTTAAPSATSTTVAPSATPTATGTPTPTSTP
ncbi:MAG: NBR1-Ig-like domain-containing protein [Chloroflexota bacterium]